MRGNKGGEAFNRSNPLVARHPQARLTRHADDVVAGHVSTSITFTVAHIKAATGRPITPLNKSKTNNRPRSVGGGLFTMCPSTRVCTPNSATERAANPLDVIAARGG
jgi:hypothetical protein